MPSPIELFKAQVMRAHDLFDDGWSVFSEDGSRAIKELPRYSSFVLPLEKTHSRSSEPEPA